MDSVGEFQLEEMDGNSFLVYHPPKYHQTTQSPTSASHDRPFEPLFRCPITRYIKDYFDSGSVNFPITSAPEYIVSIGQRDQYHSVLPLFWCNNKTFDDCGGCFICSGSKFGTDYYLCVYHDEILHKECVQSPLEIKQPYHPEHSLQLWYINPNTQCLCCGRVASCLVYNCISCGVVMHPTCAMKSIPFVVDQPKSHDHPLTFFPRQASLTCNVCGLLRKNCPTYICARCNFVAHNDCMYSPRIIKISRHPHRISYRSSLQSGKWSCGVCRQSTIECYGAYACEKCVDYVVHIRCALGKDVWDGEELEGVPEEDVIAKDVGPFDMISQGVIHHFLHDHHLSLEVNVLYDENKFCQACALPIYQGNVYSCMKCDFILHEICANAPRRLQHALHPHPLILKAASTHPHRYFFCAACARECNGFVYECRIGECLFDLDVRCALISEPFDYQGHAHPLFLALGREEKPICQVCESTSRNPLYCIDCGFIVCVRCATLPYETKYKHDRHFLFLTILHENKLGKNYSCEICERSFGDTDTKMFYWCNDCCTMLHIECLLGENPYIKRRGLLSYV